MSYSLLLRIPMFLESWVLSNLEGLILEAKSEVRNIKSAIGAYDTLIKNWPQSDYWRKANERSIYLKRFYIDIR